MNVITQILNYNAKNLLINSLIEKFKLEFDVFCNY